MEIHQQTGMKRHQQTGMKRHQQTGMKKLCVRDIDAPASLFLRKAYHLVSNCPPSLGRLRIYSYLRFSSFHYPKQSSEPKLQGVGRKMATLST